MNIRKIVLAGFALITLLSSIAASFAAAPPPVPALPDSERRTAYSISGTNCACSVGFSIYGDSNDVDAWLEVWIAGTRYLSTDPTFGWTITSPSNPSLAVAARPITDAVLTFNSVQTGTVQIVGAVRPRRTVQFSENRGVAARDLNQAITYIISSLREFWDKLNDVTGRALISQPGNTLGPLPLPSQCGGKFLGFDVTGLIPKCNVGGPGSGNVNGIGSSVAGNAPVYSDTSGGVIQDSGIKPVTPSACSTSNWFNTLSAGALGCSQPNFTDLAGSIAGAQISTGTITSGMILDGTIANADINASAAIALSKLASQAANTTACNPTGGAAVPVACTQTQLTAQVNVATASASGAVPTLPNTGTKFFRDDGTYQVPPGGGQMTLLNTLTASASANLQDTSSFTATYSSYAIIIEGLLPSTASSTLILMVHSGGSFQTATYLTTTTLFTTVTASGPFTTSLQFTAGNNVPNTGDGFSGTMFLFAPSVASGHKMMRGDGAYFNGASLQLATFGGYWNGGTGAVDGIEVCASTTVPTCIGTLTSGTIKIYGIQ